MEFEIGIPVYNEERNIDRLLNFLVNEQFSHELKNIFIVCSGCTDNSEGVVKKYSKINNKIVLIHEGKRLGIPHALNQILKLMKTSILVHIDAEDLPEKGSINKLINYFKDPQVGAVDGHPIPKNGFKLAGTVRELYNEIYMPFKSKKGTLDFLTGEICAFRNVIPPIPLSTISEDLWIGKTIFELGYKIKYCEEAISTFKNPPNILEYLNQRVRFRKGNQQIKKDTVLSSLSRGPFFTIKFVLYSFMKFNWVKLIAMFFLEIISIIKSKFYKNKFFLAH